MQFYKVFTNIFIMLNKKVNIVVGLTTFNTEMLQISIPALGKLKQKFLLVIYNDNPTTTVSRHQIRKLGYTGKIEIINTSEKVGVLRGRMKIVDEIKNLKSLPDWIIFNDDDDILTDLTIPEVSDNIFSIVQNSIIIRHRLQDLMHAINNSTSIDIDGENVIISRPNMYFVGMLIRTSLLIETFDFIKPLLESIEKIDNSLGYRPPVDLMLRTLLTMYAKFKNPDLSPIYMDKVNYIKTELDTATVKYDKLNKPARNITEHYKRAIAKYEILIKSALDAIAPQGL